MPGPEPDHIVYLKDVIIPLASGLGGVILAIVPTSWFQRRSIRWSTTDSLIQEFYSPSFLQHRASLWATKVKVMNGLVPIRDIAKGFWYTSDAMSSPYDGDLIYDFTEHEHITIMMGYYIRMSHLMTIGRIDKKHLKLALSAEYHWHADVLTGICIETEREFKARSETLPSFVPAIMAINHLFDYSIIDAIRTKGILPRSGS